MGASIEAVKDITWIVDARALNGAAMRLEGILVLTQHAPTCTD